MKTHYCKSEKTIIDFEDECNWCGEKEMKQHKWHKEIKAWADGAEIESRFKDKDTGWSEWDCMGEILAFSEDDWWEYRIKPQPKELTEEYWNRRMAEKALAIPEISAAVDRLFEAFAVKEPQYLYVYKNKQADPYFFWSKITPLKTDLRYQGKIKLETGDD